MSGDLMVFKYNRCMYDNWMVLDIMILWWCYGDAVHIFDGIYIYIYEKGNNQYYNNFWDIKIQWFANRIS